MAEKEHPAAALPVTVLAAPMEGLTDHVWRNTHCALFGGAAAYYTPFQRLTQTFRLTVREQRDVDPASNRGAPVIPQALTRDGEQLLRYLEYVKALGYGEADLNLGCPSPTVTKRGRGSALLRDRDTLETLLKRAEKEGALPLSVKTRIGYESPDEWDGLLALFSDHPLTRVTIHLRTTKEGYEGPIHPEAYEKALRALGDRAVYNGDLRTAEDLAAFVCRFGPGHTVMAGRGLFADPALAPRAAGGPPASAEDWRTFLASLLDQWQSLYGLTVALGRVKKLMVYPLSAPEQLPLFRPFRKASCREDFDWAVEGFCERYV